MFIVLVHGVCDVDRKYVMYMLHGALEGTALLNLAVHARA